MTTALGSPRRSGTPWLLVGVLAGVTLGLVAGPALAGTLGTSRNGSSLLVTGDQPPEHAISVTGTGSVQLVPDIAELRLGVLAQRKTVREARADAAKAMSAVIAALRKLGIAERDIRTSALSLQPVYEYKPNGGTPRIVGYELRDGITVTIRDLDQVGPAVDDALTAGATTLDSLSFQLADPTTGERQAREEAMADARARADALARAAGVDIVGVASISESVSRPPWPWYGETAGVRDGTPIMPGVNDVSVTVSVVYLID